MMQPSPTLMLTRRWFLAATTTAVVTRTTTLAADREYEAAPWVRWPNGPVDQVPEQTGEWLTYRFVPIPPHPGPWELDVQFNDWSSFGSPVTFSVDDLVCNPTPEPQ